MNPTFRPCPPPSRLIQSHNISTEKRLQIRRRTAEKDENLKGGCVGRRRESGLNKKISECKTSPTSVYFPNPSCFSLSKALGGVSRKYAFKLMHDVISHLPLAQRLSLPLSLHLLSLQIFSLLPPLPTASLNPPPSPHPLTHLFCHFFPCLIYSVCLKALIIYLKLWSSLKGRNRRGG